MWSHNEFSKLLQPSISATSTSVLVNIKKVLGKKLIMRSECPLIGAHRTKDRNSNGLFGMIMAIPSANVPAFLLKSLGLKHDPTEPSKMVRRTTTTGIFAKAPNPHNSVIFYPWGRSLLGCSSCFKGPQSSNRSRVCEECWSS